jgi:hypothetical protein
MRCVFSIIKIKIEMKYTKTKMKKFLLNYKGNKYKADTLVGIVFKFIVGKKIK